MGGSKGNMLGQVLSDPNTLRHILLNNNLWLACSQPAQALFVDTLFKATCGGDVLISLRKYNRAACRSAHLFRHLLMATLDARLTPDRLTQLLLLLKYLLLDESPYVPHIRALASFLSATLSSQLNQVLTRLNGEGFLDYPILETTQLPCPPSVYLPAPPAFPLPSASPLLSPPAVTNQVIVTVRNHLFLTLPWLVSLLVGPPSPPSAFRYRNALIGAMPLRWLCLFADSNCHITTVTAALRLTVSLMPLYGPKLVGPTGERSLSKVCTRARFVLLLFHCGGYTFLVVSTLSTF